MGFCKVPLSKVMEYGKIDRWYSLSPCDFGPKNLIVTTTSNEQLKPKGRRKSLMHSQEKQHEDADGPRLRNLVNQVNNLSKELLQPPRKSKAHEFVEKKNNFTSFSQCAICKTTIVGSCSACSECNLVCHNKCKDNVQNICGGVGSIRLKITLTVSIFLFYS